MGKGLKEETNGEVRRKDRSNLPVGGASGRDGSWEAGLVASIATGA